MLNTKSFQQGVVEGCQGTQVVRDGLIQAMVTGYPQPAVMWFRDVWRTSRITNDSSIYRLLPNGDVSYYNIRWSTVNYDIYKQSYIIKSYLLALVVCSKLL